jgi:hypothetical protein
LIKLCRRKFFQRRDGLVQSVSFCPIYLLRRCAVTFASISLHVGLQFYRSGPLRETRGSCPNIKPPNPAADGKLSGDPHLVKINFLS